MKTLLFTYGTLMRQYANHHYCRNAISIEPAKVCGKLYQLSAGYPALQVPNESILRTGIADAFDSVRVQFQENTNMNFEFQINKGWDTVHGELVTFNNPDEISPIDRLEGTPFFYDRVLIPARKADGSIIAVWAYVMHEIPKLAQYLPNGIWPEIQKTEVEND